MMPKDKGQVVGSRDIRPNRPLVFDKDSVFLFLTNTKRHTIPAMMINQDTMLS